MLNDALCYASRGWPVFPCRRRGKEPLVPGGFKSATTDPATIRSWWRRYAQPNIGMPTGRASGVVVLDVDPRNGGDETLLDLPPLPHTVECLTGGGGRHVYLQWPGFEVRCRSNALGPGLDLKADGGYVLLPPSVHPSGRRYEWELSSHPDDTPIAPMPDWLLDMLRPATGTSPEKSAGCRIQNSVRLPVGRRTLQFIAQGAPIGEQRLRAVAAARNLLSAGYSIEAAGDAIWQGLQASDWDPTWPWTEADALKIVADLASKPAPPVRPLERKTIYDGSPDFSGEVPVGGSRFRIVYDAPPDFSGEVKPYPKSRYPVIQKLSVEVGA